MQGAANPAQSPTEPSEITKKPPLIVHVIHYLGVGGLENGLVNLINHIPSERYRHAIICLKGYSDFSKRITRKNVKIVALNKREGLDFRLYAFLTNFIHSATPNKINKNTCTYCSGDGSHYQIKKYLQRNAGNHLSFKIRIHGRKGSNTYDSENDNSCQDNTNQHDKCYF